MKSSNPRHHQNLFYFQLSKLVKRPRREFSVFGKTVHGLQVS